MFDFLKPKKNRFDEQLEAVKNIIDANLEVQNMAITIANVPLDRPISLAMRKRLVKAIGNAEFVRNENIAKASFRD